MNKIKCQYCGQVLSEGANFCSACGKPLKNKICVECRAINTPENKFCVNCGTNLAAYKGQVKGRQKTQKDIKKSGNQVLYSGIFVVVSAVLLYVFFAKVKLNDNKTAEPALNQIEIRNKVISEINFLKEKVKKDSNNLESYIRLGNLFFDIENKSEAIIYYKKALEIDDTNAEVRIDMGICYFESGDPEIAIDEIKKALEFSPNHPQGLYNLGIINYSTGRTVEAAEWWNKYLAVEPQGRLADKAKEYISEIIK